MEGSREAAGVKEGSDACEVVDVCLVQARVLSVSDGLGVQSVPEASVGGVSGQTLSSVSGGALELVGSVQGSGSSSDLSGSVHEVVDPMVVSHGYLAPAASDRFIGSCLTSVDCSSLAPALSIASSVLVHIPVGGLASKGSGSLSRDISTGQVMVSGLVGVDGLVKAVTEVAKSSITVGNGGGATLNLILV